MKTDDEIIKQAYFNLYNYEVSIDYSLKELFKEVIRLKKEECEKEIQSLKEEKEYWYGESWNEHNIQLMQETEIMDLREKLKSSRLETLKKIRNRHGNGEPYLKFGMWLDSEIEKAEEDGKQ